MLRAAASILSRLAVPGGAAPVLQRRLRKSLALEAQWLAAQQEQLALLSAARKRAHTVAVAAPVHGGTEAGTLAAWFLATAAFAVGVYDGDSIARTTPSDAQFLIRLTFAD